MWISQELPTHNHIQAPLEAGEAPCEFIGEEVQRLNVVLNLPTLLETEQASCMAKILPKVQLALPSASTEFHMAASSTFKTILEKQLVHPRTFTQTFLQSILTSIESRDTVVANAWLETLLDVIELLPVDVIRSDILPLAVQKGQLNQKLTNRITSCKLLGKIALRFDQGAIKKDVLSLILSLCQDIRAEVRASACLQLSYVTKGLGVEDVKPSLLPSLVELAGDTEKQVRLAACQAIVEIAPFLQKESQQTTIIPLCRKLLTAAMKAQDEVMISLARLYGRMCLALEAAMTMEEKRGFITSFCELAQIGVKFKPRRDQMPDVVPAAQESARLYAECRHNCAFNFPAMVVFANIRGADNWMMLYPVLSELGGDPYYLVRKTIATGIHEVAKTLSNNASCLKPDLLRLLRDEEEEVLSGLIPNLSTMLLIFVKTKTFGPDMQESAMELGKSLLKCEVLVSRTNDWRLHEALLVQWQSLPHILPSDFLYNHFVNVLFERIHRSRQLPVRIAAGKALLFLLRFNLKTPQRNDIISRLSIELAQGRSCYSRMGFIKLCRSALEVFSHKFFKEQFFVPLIDITEDVVANNRLMVVAMLPQLKATLVLPSDKKLLTSLEAAVRRLLSQEKDRDVVKGLRQAVTKMDAVDVVQELAKRAKVVDLEDTRRMDEEIKIASKCSMKGDVKPPPRMSMGIPTQELRRTTSPGPGGVHAVSQILSSTTMREVDARRRGPDSIITSVGQRSSLGATPTQPPAKAATPPASAPPSPSKRVSNPSAGAIVRPGSNNSMPPTSSPPSKSAPASPSLSPSPRGDCCGMAADEYLRLLATDEPAMLPSLLGRCFLDDLHHDNRLLERETLANLGIYLSDNPYNLEFLTNNKASELPNLDMLRRMSANSSANDNSCNKTFEYEHLSNKDNTFTEDLGMHPIDKAERENLSYRTSYFDRKSPDYELPHPGNHWSKGTERADCESKTSGVGFLSNLDSYLNTTKPDFEPRSKRFLVFSLEEEFFVDAGIKIPHNFTSNHVPSRIPNLREMLFKARNSDEKESDRESSTSLSDLGICKARKESVSLKSVLMSPGTIANRRHSYLEPPLKTKLLEAPRKMVVDNSNRRHSYIEKLQITVRNDIDKPTSFRLTRQNSDVEKPSAFRLTRQNSDIEKPSAFKLTRQNSDNPIFRSKREGDFPRRKDRSSFRVKSEVETISNQIKSYQTKKSEEHQSLPRYQPTRRNVEPKLHVFQSSLKENQARGFQGEVSVKSEESVENRTMFRAKSSSIQQNAGMNRRSLNFASTSDRLRTAVNRRHSTMEVDSLVLESRLQRPGFVLANRRTASPSSRTTTNGAGLRKTAPNSRSTSPTLGSVRTSLGGFKSPDVGSRLPVRKKT